jgi:hypothetical protein
MLLTIFTKEIRRFYWHYKTLEKIKKKKIQKFRKFGNIFFDAIGKYFYFKKQSFSWKFARGRKIKGARS